MSKRLTFAAATALALCLPLPALAEDTPTSETVVATVNGKDITLGHMILVRANLPQDYNQLPDEVLFDGILNQLVQQSVLAETLDDTPRRVEMAVENEKRQLLAAEAVDDLLAGAMTDAALQEAYEAQYANAEPSREWNASHILVESEEEAAALVDRARGGDDFAQLARDHSTGPSGPNGGELGWFSAGMMVPPFEEAVNQLDAEGISDPVQTQFGWHVIRLNETRLKDVPPLEEVREELEMQLQQQIVEARVQELTDAATVERAVEGIDKSLLSNIDLLEK
ncbi:peptidylprolyl isomerase [Lutimaribacter sp. EGI FJ00015]|uniref:Peptidylprolyl isomerase n=1 Tax=Lutimaribacter degradans TaxID=2945989 RepID=A0ACC5ZUQ9_9RHOB|nr:peptidylprolyl isomerase [Lutimaribacter sp. EGI FJ00013]MCM2561928.1 peptidylprolyl isomerase [Lutimaribacter sp. EGI FJ00013]MCO0613040.1 peptidylprolyl isomerase [Lutimaribacter sp. EGI FJ00015]MCO0635760.1 peptidylprolyl isomerase [Lutimaribacter sp. EGI FJ00014]